MGLNYPPPERRRLFFNPAQKRWPVREKNSFVGELEIIQDLILTRVLSELTWNWASKTFWWVEGVFSELARGDCFILDRFINAKPAQLCIETLQNEPASISIRLFCFLPGRSV